ncbi:unnamed protein product [Protopolystoma xenopodis]|uniref:Uncharacterized protein n=1 Tax=Protopolystoma xenopodis TaxID=117903 RepID=A0A3S5C3H6_9PLAT|nr:unnamed protein product [Protopolystoma xenopodis]
MTRNSHSDAISLAFQPFFHSPLSQTVDNFTDSPSAFTASQLASPPACPRRTSKPGCTVCRGDACNPLPDLPAASAGLQTAEQNEPFSDNLRVVKPCCPPSDSKCPSGLVPAFILCANSACSCHKAVPTAHTFEEEPLNLCLRDAYLVAAWQLLDNWMYQSSEATSPFQSQPCQLDAREQNRGKSGSSTEANDIGSASEAAWSSSTPSFVMPSFGQSSRPSEIPWSDGDAGIQSRRTAKRESVAEVGQQRAGTSEGDNFSVEKKPKAVENMSKAVQSVGSPLAKQIDWFSWQTATTAKNHRESGLSFTSLQQFRGLADKQEAHSGRLTDEKQLLANAFQGFLLKPQTQRDIIHFGASQQLINGPFSMIYL